MPLHRIRGVVVWCVTAEDRKVGREGRQEFSVRWCDANVSYVRVIVIMANSVPTERSRWIVCVRKLGGTCFAPLSCGEGRLHRAAFGTQHSSGLAFHDSDEAVDLSTNVIDGKSAVVGQSRRDWVVKAGRVGRNVDGPFIVPLGEISNEVLHISVAPDSVFEAIAISVQTRLNYHNARPSYNALTGATR